MRTVYLINQSTVVPSAAFDTYVSAQIRQVTKDLMRGSSNVQFKTAASPPAGKECVIYLDNSDQAGALGYHTTDTNDVPQGFVFCKTSLADTGEWTVTGSHEVLEQLSDGMAALTIPALFMGVHVCLAYEICDPVEDESYSVDGVELSNFAYSSWFVDDTLKAGRKLDFLGTRKFPRELSTGGYVAYTRDSGISWHQVFGRTSSAHKKTSNRYSRVHRRYNRLPRHIACSL